MYKSYKKKTILITGSSGFLGKKILKKLDKKKYNIIVITRKKIAGVKNIFVKDLFSLNIIQYKKLLRTIKLHRLKMRYLRLILKVVKKVLLHHTLLLCQQFSGYLY